MGDVWIPDRAVTLEEIQASLSILEEEYHRLGVGQHRLKVGWTGAMLVIRYAAAVHGEELPQVDVGMIRKYWNEGRDYKRKPHVPLALVGRFKQTNGIEDCNTMDVKAGPMFRTTTKANIPKRTTISNLDNLFHDILKQVQLRHLDIISPDLKKEDVFSIRRSLRRGATTEAQNRKIPKSIIESNNRWKKHMRANGLLPLMSMMERYTDASRSNYPVLRTDVKMKDKAT
ncbi:hypothetical protein ACA910_003716 [Epithemia clementina (nom. ined.)]